MYVLAVPSDAHWQQTQRRRRTWVIGLTVLAHLLLIWGLPHWTRVQRALPMLITPVSLIGESKPQGVDAPKAAPRPKPASKPAVPVAPELPSASGAAAASAAPEASAAEPPPAAPVLPPSAVLAARDSNAITVPGQATVEPAKPTPAPPLRYQPPQAGARAVQIFYGDYRDNNLVGKGRLQIDYPDQRPDGSSPPADLKPYKLLLEAEASGLTSLVFPGKLVITSSGRLGPTGFEPERYTYAAGKRSERATNINRDTLRVTFSSNDRSFAMEPGLQDRLSVVLQMALLAQDDPQRVQPGARMPLQLAGLGSVAPMVFKTIGTQIMTLAHGDEPVVYLATDQPLERDASKIEVWLSLSRGYAPLRFRYTESNGRELDIVLLAEGMALAPVAPKSTPREF